MDDLRLKQAEKLIIKAGHNKQKSDAIKEPQEGVINVESFENALKNLIEAEDFIYSSLPSHKLSSEDAQLFCQKILDSYENLQNILADFSVLEKISSEDKIQDLSQSVLIITTKSGFKKSLAKLGADVKQILVAGVPLETEDMKEINPKIPEAALNGISKKIEHIKNDIARKLENSDIKKVIVLGEPDINGKVLGKRAQEYYQAQVVLKENLKDLKDFELVTILSSD